MDERFVTCLAYLFRLLWLCCVTWGESKSS